MSKIFRAYRSSPVMRPYEQVAKNLCHLVPGSTLQMVGDSRLFTTLPTTHPEGAGSRFPAGSKGRWGAGARKTATVRLVLLHVDSPSYAFASGAPAVLDM
jgi:hypothetical protein